MESSASDSHSIFAFWKARYVPRTPQSSSTATVIPVSLGWNAISFPRFSMMIQPTMTISAQNILGIQFALSSIATGIGKSYLICRNFFLLLVFLSFIYGIVLLALGNTSGIIPVVMTVFWVGLTRLMANRLMLSLGEGEIVMENKVRELNRSYLGGEVEVKLGRSMQWVVVADAGYRPPNLDVVSGIPVPIGVPI